MSAGFRTVVAPQQLRAQLGDPGLVAFDCRHRLTDFGYGRRAYEQGHLPGAYFASVEDDLSGPKTGSNGRHPLPDPQAFAAFLRAHGVDADTQIVGYDDGGDMFAARLWFLCRWIGHDAVAVLDGGIAAWTALGYPTTDDAPPAPRPGTIAARVRSDIVVDAGYVYRHLHDPGVRVLDARAPDRFAGQNETVDPVAGHIPGAHNRFFKANFDARGAFLEPEALRAGFAAYGDPATIVHQCGSGVSAAANLLAMEHAGLHGSRVYAGSWSEWIADPQRPIETGATPPAR